MSAKVTLNIESNLGYGPDQVTGITLADLREMVEEAVTEWGGDTEVVICQINNPYGANYGQFAAYDLFQSTEDEENDDDR